jgi:membrane protein DedA with SNARE-associated domain
MTGLEHFLRDYGLWALFFAAAIEGDIALLLTGMMIHLGVWRAGDALMTGAVGAMAGDIFYFWLGHGTGRRWLTTAHGQRVMPRIERFAHKYGMKSLIFGRYIYGARAATMIFWGMHGMHLPQFLLIDILNCTIWALLFGGIGYLFSSSVIIWLGKLRVIESWLLIGLVFSVVIIGLRYYAVEVTRLPEDADDEETRGLTP